MNIIFEINTFRFIHTRTIACKINFNKTFTRTSIITNQITIITLISKFFTITTFISTLAIRYFISLLTDAFIIYWDILEIQSSVTVRTYEYTANLSSHNAANYICAGVAYLEISLHADTSTFHQCIEISLIASSASIRLIGLRTIHLQTPRISSASSINWIALQTIYACFIVFATVAIIEASKTLQTISG